MIDITHKSSTLRTALAQATVKVSKAETIQAINDNAVPKGNVLEIARAAGLLGIKQTANLIPDCHPMPIEYTGIDYELGEMEIEISVEVKTVYKTGVEVEAMHAASLVALTLYDMLKPIDKGITIENIRLIKKKGGKSDYANRYPKGLKAAVVVCSDSVSAGKKEDKAGQAILDKLKAFDLEVTAYDIIPDEQETIQAKVKALIADGVDLLLFTGGTGLSDRDVTPEAIAPMIERDIPGIMEAARKYGQERMPYAMLSRGVAGTIGKSIVITMPGSTGGARESMDALFPAVLHIFDVLKGFDHQKK
jgi:molybdenum cofactor biosynthesis protein MoaC